MSTCRWQRHYVGNPVGCPYEYEVGAKRGDIDSRMPGFCRGDRPVALVSGKQQSAGKTTIGSHKDTKGTAAISQRSAKNENPRLKKTTSPQFPCLRRVPFDATKRNQKSPLGAGPSICIARIASRDAHDPLPCQPRRNIGPRRWTEPRALL